MENEYFFLKKMNYRDGRRNRCNAGWSTPSLRSDSPARTESTPQTHWPTCKWDSQKANCTPSGGSSVPSTSTWPGDCDKQYDCRSSRNRPPGPHRPAHWRWRFQTPEADHCIGRRWKPERPQRSTPNYDSSRQNTFPLGHFPCSPAGCKVERRSWWFSREMRAGVEQCRFSRWTGRVRRVERQNLGAGSRLWAFASARRGNCCGDGRHRDGSWRWPVRSRSRGDRWSRRCNCPWWRPRSRGWARRRRPARRSCRRWRARGSLRFWCCLRAGCTDSLEKN